MTAKRFARAPAGFTLVELMVVVSVLALLASLAAPSMGRIIAAQRVKSSASNLHLALLKARSEAIKRNSAVTLEPVTGSNWASGWNIRSGTTTIDVTQAQARVVVTPTPNPTPSLTYRADGRLNGAAVMFVMSSEASPTSRCVSVDPTGRPYVKEASTC